MDFNSILNEIKPTESENKEIQDMSRDILDYLTFECEKRNVDAEIFLVGSVSKGTYLKGKSDIDVFISFPLDTPVEELKETGLILGYACSDHFDGEAGEHYASHPYITSKIDKFEVDFVPCYRIRDGSELKSAVDRTILHTNYIKKHLQEYQKDEVLLLKRFMDMTGTYGSEFKVGGFAGYLCELLIIKYGTFENTLNEASNWRYGHVIDLENYGTSKMFKDPLVVIDPTDKNRNVGAALRLDKMAEFIQSARNYLNSDNKLAYFYPIEKNISKDYVIKSFDERGSDVIALQFRIPEIPLDTLHPQLMKTVGSIAERLDGNGFNVFNYGYWTDEESVAIFVFEMANAVLNKVDINKGPKIFIKKACKQFIDAHGIENCFVQDDYLVQAIERKHDTAEGFIDDLLTEKNITKIKVGKNLTESILDSYSFCELEDLVLSDDFWSFCDDLIVPGQYIRR
ncbi:MAG: CCA tRNA nucleotidyltransferase [Methanobrevibacter sp.]|uniref:CCA tRNA nucleotidyltransferase n=1 Tax=Methanobrevibacter sp. TaxID=66852 RepID=UPI0026E08C51|nr:CCA tRNA nucleotidyltransferase [Methanobrevibacter sp.]MDO5849510.1 CCA tRNA nucleotidyltransferase [Methanobrevibacter sp.]